MATGGTAGAFVAAVLCLWAAGAGAKTVGKFWAFADAHFDEEYRKGGDPKLRCTAKANGTKGASEFGDFACDTPAVMLQSAVGFMASVEPNADFVLWAGDATPHYEDAPYWEPYTPAMMLRAIEHTNAVLGSRFKRVYFTIGNHDTYPLEFLPPPEHGGTEWYVNVSTTLRHFAMPPEALAEFRYSGFFAASPVPGLLVVSLNTM